MTAEPANNRRLLLFGGLNVVMGALAMVATFPGRTHGLGMVTEPLLKDLDLARTSYADINLWATLLGAATCIPVGWLIDRWGTRWTAVLVTALLGITVLVMSKATTAAELFVVVLLTRALGQSALSVVSISIVAKWFKHGASLAMSIYTGLMGMMFFAAFGVVGWGVRNYSWREVWGAIGLVLLAAFAPLFALLVRSAPKTRQIVEEADAPPSEGYLLGEALRTPSFWIFAGAASLYGLVSSGAGLFNQDILHERGFDQHAYHNLMMGSALFGIIGQFACGGLVLKWSLHRLLSVAMVMYVASLLMLPYVEGYLMLYTYAAVMAGAGGIVTVIFFAIWGKAFGQAHLGRIQGAAQMLTVLASAIGPVLFAQCKEITGTYMPLFYTLAAVVLSLGLAAAWAPIPVKKTSPPLAEMAVVS